AIRSIWYGSSRGTAASWCRMASTGDCHSPRCSPAGPGWPCASPDERSEIMTTRALPHLLLSALLVLTAIGLSLTAGTGALLALGMIAVAVAITLVGLVRFGSQFVLIALLVVGYFSGWIKIRTGSWIGSSL